MIGYLILFAAMVVVCTVGAIVTAAIALDMRDDGNDHLVSAMFWIFAGIFTTVAGATLAKAVTL